MEIGAWLEEVGLRQYEQAFIENGVDELVLLKLTSEDLKEIGVVAVGHRRRLIEAIALLGVEAARSAELPTSSGVVAASSFGRASAQDAERRQLTVMFCDLAGSTELSTRLDPEELRDLLAAYRSCVTETVHRHSGYVAKHMGDGVLVYFGYPDAHEEDAERAVRAGLDLVGSVSALEVYEGKLQVRIGIATGLVVVGDLVGSDEAQERGIAGEAPNLAARLQSLAEPDGVMIAAETRRRVGGLFNCRSIGLVEARGFPEPVEAFQVLSESEVASRFDALRSVRAPIIGRDEETALLRKRWEQVCGGDGRVVLIAGEPGIGKSRLVASFMDETKYGPQQQVRLFCAPHHVASPLLPVIRYLENAAGFAQVNDDEAKRRKLDAFLAKYATSAVDRAVLVELLSLEPERGALPDQMGPQIRKERTLAAITGLFEAMSRRRPTVILWEDAHWIDATSLELLGSLVPSIQNLPALLLITFRPEFVAPWSGQAGVTSLTLSRLERRHNAALAKEVAGGGKLPTELLNEIVARTDGVPLFIEELTRSVLESGLLRKSDDGYILDAPFVPRAVPDSLHASLMARLDRLGGARHVAQVGAAVGREFSYQLLATTLSQPESELREALARLVEAELLFVRGQPPSAIYQFKHALLQEAAYDALLKSKRRELHARIAWAMEESQPETADRQPEMLAAHCALGGLLDRAVDLWLKAGRRAASSSANREAIAHLTQALETLRRLPETVERDRLEIEIQFALGPALFATRGWTDPDAGQSYRRARELCERLGEERQRFDALWGLRYGCTAHGETEESLALLDEMLSTAERLADDECRLQAHHAAWVSFSWLGDQEKAWEHVKNGLKLYDPKKHAAHALRYGGHDAGVCARGHGGLPLWLLGYPDQAVRLADDGLKLAESLAHGPSLAHGRHCQTNLA